MSTKKTTKNPSFFQCDISDRVRAWQRRSGGSKILYLNSIINWKRIDYKLNRIHKSARSGETPGVVPYDPVKMFKAILLQSWHQLSDTELEDALALRIDFIAFTGLDERDFIPDETTICRFRNKLVEKNLHTKLLAEVDNQLEALGLKVEQSRGAIVDATLITSAARPRRTLTEIPQDRSEPDIDEDGDDSEDGDVDSTNFKADNGNANADDSSCEDDNGDANVDDSSYEDNDSSTNTDSTTLYKKTESCDPDSTWLKKGNHCHFGYKAFASVDVEDGYVEHVHLTPANKSEVRQLDKVVASLENGTRVYADKGYASLENRELLHSLGLKDGLMEKAVRGRPLSERQRQKNRLISKDRYKVEREFGVLKRRFGAGKASYLGLRKAEAQFVMRCLCHNLLKAVNKVLAVEAVVPEVQFT